jgi:2-polyprenylphenol 6-hydroxylase
MNADTDVLIVGGGLVGACLATLLARQRTFPAARITVLEPRLPQRPGSADDIDLRVSAVSRASQRILSACGVWEGLITERASPYERMRVWDAASRLDASSAICFDCATVGEQDLGHIVENRRMQWALLEEARIAGVTLIESGVKELEAGTDGIRVELLNGARLVAPLLVAADGADSPTRHLMGIERSAVEHGRAVVTHIVTANPHQRTAWQRFLPTGPIALLPLHDGRSSIVWSTTDEQVRELMAMDDRPFCRAVEEATDRALGTVESCARRAQFPLRSSHAAHYVAEHFALVGDAAHAVHPLAGQGVNLGFLDSAALAQVLSEALAQGDGAGDLRVLRRYERWRKGENLVMLNALDGFNRLFSNESTWLGMLRRAGLAVANDVQPLKHFFLRRALGLNGDLPAAARAGVSQGH